MSAGIDRLDRRKILRALNIPETEKVPEPDAELYAPLEEQISRCEAEILEAALLKTVYRILPVSDLEGILRGNDIRMLLADCEEAVLMALTLGSDLEKRLMREEVLNMSDAYVLDVCASQAVEAAADDFERKLRSRLLSQGKYLTNRFCPGYGDLPLDTQKSLLDITNAARAIGLTLTRTDLMVPRKSLTAVMGISSRPKKAIYGGCAHCPLLTKCSFRAHQERCYDK